MKMSKSDKNIIKRVFVILGLIAIVLLVVAGGLTWKANSFAESNVKTQLSQQKIFFPTKNSPEIKALPAVDQVQMDKYAGQQLVNGEQAKVYANNFIAYHLSKVADGKTYAQVSTEALANPSNAQLKAEEATLFQGETLRGMLLGDGYSYWTFGEVAGWTSIIAFVCAVVVAVLVLIGLRQTSRQQ